MTYAENRIDGSCDSNYTLVRTYTATDFADNKTIHTQTINVQDTTAPSFVEALPADLTAECDAVPVPETLTASDSCNANVEISFTETISGKMMNVPIITLSPGTGPLQTSPEMRLSIPR